MSYPHAARDAARISVGPSDGKQAYFDRLQFRMAQPATESELDFLRRHSRSTSLRWSKMIPWRPWLLVVVLPYDAALRFLAQQDWLLNGAEIAREVICRNEAEVAQLDDFTTRHFVQRWAGKHAVCRFVNKKTGTHVTYSGQRRKGRRFVWYGDRPSKITGEVDCFRFEARLSGVDALRRIGLNTPADLLAFDHEAFWAEHERFEDVDHARLGRWWANQLEGSSRQKARITRCGSYRYDHDIAVGNLLWRALSILPRQEDAHAAVRSVQHFRQGITRLARQRGWTSANKLPFMHPLDPCTSY